MVTRLRTMLFPERPQALAFPSDAERARTADLRRGWQLAAALILACLLALHLRPLAATVQGERRVLPRRVTAGRAAELSGLSLRPGDLVDVGGLVLKPGAGRPAVLLRNGQPVPPETRLRRRDVLSVIPGQPLTEPHHEHARLLRAHEPGLAPPAVLGIRRTLEGQVSEHQVVQLSTVEPTVPTREVPRKRLALTFDDGPWPDATGQILATLKRHGARATFFVLGAQARARQELVRRAVAQGCEIGIHSWGHTAYPRLGGAGVRQDLQRCEALLRPLVGHPLKYGRPPYGATNSTVAGAIRNAGYRQVLWSVDTNDWRRPGANAIAYRILSRAHDGAIVLCHDGGGSRSGTVAAIARVVPQLKARGYELVTLTELYSSKPGGAGGAITVASGQRFAVRPSVAGLAVMVDDVLAELPDAPVEIDDHLLLPVKPVLAMLGVTCEWDEEGQTLRLAGTGARLKLRLNSTLVETATGRTHETPVPPVLYGGRAMVPLPVVLEASGATASYDRETRVLRLISPAGLLRTGRAGWSENRYWLAGQPWTVRYAARW
jgi:peptidoglycan/xylan/chitin deacetylase (PgdA/CDA1 family)